MSIGLRLSDDLLCPNCGCEFSYGLRYNLQECPNCKLQFIGSTYVRYSGNSKGMLIPNSTWYTWATECDDGVWRIPEGKYIFDEEEQRKWGVK